MISTHIAFVLGSVLLYGLTAVSALSEGEVCTGTPDACDSPLSCVGNPQNMKCFMKKALGMTCGQDPFWVCQDGLVCSDGTCTEMIREAGSCNSLGSVCAAPLSCVGNEGNKKCFMKKVLGMTCGQDPFWVCEDGLVCSDGTCAEPKGEAGSCNLPGSVCTPPLSCVGNDGNKKCFMKKGLGMNCGKDPFWVCEDGSMCISGTCKKPVGRADSCSDPDSGCVPPFTCAGSSGTEKCVKMKFRGMRCDDSPFSACAPRLTCDTDGICKKERGVRGKCGTNFLICKPPLACVGTPELKRCVMKKGVGMACGKDPFWVCQDDLECVGFRCREK